MNAALATAQALATILSAIVVYDGHILSVPRIKSADGTYLAQVRADGTVTLLVEADGRMCMRDLSGSTESVAAQISARHASK
jgi:hypothetical protein